MKINASPYSKNLYVWNNISATFFYGGITPLHSHNTMQIAFDTRKQFGCKIQDSDWKLYESVIIRENAIHQLNPNSSVQLILYLDAESDMANKIRAKYLSAADICSTEIKIGDHVNPGELERCLIEPNPEILATLIERLIVRLAGQPEKPVRDERVDKIVKILASDTGENADISDLAKAVYLSESRLRSLFREKTGVPLHRYIIWNRIMMAIGKIVNGSSVQDAAVECGFTDNSHFHKLLLKMFGVIPSQFIKDNSSKNIILLTRHPLNIESRFYDIETGIPNKVYSLGKFNK
jgi:AraC-like DNA-binding protein